MCARILCQGTSLSRSMSSLSSARGKSCAPPASRSTRRFASTCSTLRGTMSNWSETWISWSVQQGSVVPAAGSSTGKSSMSAGKTKLQPNPLSRLRPSTGLSRTFLDTRVLVYGDDAAEPEKQRKALDLIAEHRRQRTGVVSTQVLQEYLTAVTRKKSWMRESRGPRLRSIRGFILASQESATSSRRSIFIGCMGFPIGTPWCCGWPKKPAAGYFSRKRCSMGRSSKASRF